MDHYKDKLHFCFLSLSYRVELLPDACNSINVLRSFLGREKSNREGRDLWSSLVSKSESLSLIDVNYVLYRCDVEERDDGKGGGVYDVPHVGRMTYCGLQVKNILVHVHVHNVLYLFLYFLRVL